MRISIVNAKGGVAKTTTAIYLACAARKAGRGVVVHDADAQASASLWAEGARRIGEPLPFEVRPANVATLGLMAGSPTGTDAWDIIDAAPTGSVAKASIDAADFAVIPTSDSPLDLQQVRYLLESMPASTPKAVLVARAQLSTKACAETLHVLDTEGDPRFDTVIPVRQDVKKSFGLRPANLHEYAAMYVELENELNGTEEQA